MREKLPLTTRAIVAGSFFTGLAIMLLDPFSLGRVGGLLTLLAGIAAVVLIAMLAPPYFSNYQFQDALKTESQMSTYTNKTEDVIRDEVFKKEQELDIPITKEQIKIVREWKDAARVGECGFECGAGWAEGLAEVSVVNFWSGVGVVKVASPEEVGDGEFIGVAIGGCEGRVCIGVAAAGVA